MSIVMSIRRWLHKRNPIIETHPGLIGQDAAKNLLHVAKAMEANVLLIGPPGHGKTMLGTAYLVDLRPYRTAICNATERRQIRDVVATRPGFGFLIDEAHRLRSPEFLYPHLDAPRSTWRKRCQVFALTTTDEGMLPGPLLSRLLHVSLGPYTRKDLALIAGCSCDLPWSAIWELAALARGSPRRAKLLAQLVQRSTWDDLSALGVRRCLARLGYLLGFSSREVRFLETLATGPRSITTLAGQLGTTVGTCKLVEQPLITAGLVLISSKGRSLTSAGNEMLLTLDLARLDLAR